MVRALDKKLLLDVWRIRLHATGVVLVLACAFQSSSWPSAFVVRSSARVRNIMQNAKWRTSLFR